MSKYKRLLSNTVILGIGTFSSKVLVFLLMPLYTGILSTAEFGVADILTQTANLLIPLAAVGICDGMFRFALDTAQSDDGYSHTGIFTVGITVVAAGGAVSLGAVQLLRLFSVFDGYVFLIAAYVVCANLHSAVANFVRAQGRTVMFAAQGIVNTVLTIGLNVLFLVVWDMGALGYVLSVVVSDLIVTVGVFVAARLYRYFSLSAFNRDTLKAMLKFSIPYIPTTMMWLITATSDRYIVTAFCGSAENGLYAAAYKLPTLLSLICGVFIEAWQFSVVKDADETEREGFFTTVFKNYMGVIFMGAAVIIAASKIFTSLLLNESYYESWRYVPVLVIAMAFSALVSFLGSVYFLEKKSVMSMVTSMAGALVNVGLNFILIPKQGAMGAAVATLISYCVVYAIRAYDTKRYVRFKMSAPRLLVNAAVLTAQAVIMVCELKYWLYAQIALLIFMLIFNGKDMLMAVKPLLSRMTRHK